MAMNSSLNKSNSNVDIFNILEDTIESNDCFENDWDKFLTEEFTEDSNKMICEDCCVNLESMEHSFRCPECGIEKKSYEETSDYSASVANNYNTNNYSAVAFKVSGIDSYKYNKGLQINGSDYSKTRIRDNIKLLNQCNARSSKRLPVNLLKEAVEMYNIMQTNAVIYYAEGSKKKCVFRGNGRKGVLGACLYFVFTRNRITKTNKFLADFLDIEESYISKGRSILKDISRKNIITLPEYHETKKDYIYQHCEGLRIDKKYIICISEIIDASRSTKMRGENNATTISRCAGAIYLLKLQLDFPFNEVDIHQVCDVTIATFKKFKKHLIVNRKIINKIFKKYGIPKIDRPKKK